MAEEQSISDVINVAEFLREWYEILTEDDFSRDRADIQLNDFVCKEMGIDMKTVEEIDNVCRVSSLTCPGEPRELEAILRTVPPNVDLMTTSIQQLELEKRAKDPMYKKKARERMKYLFEDGPWIHFFREKSSDISTPITLPEILLTVKVYKHYTGKYKPVVDQEFQVLGQQKLTELRDCVKCPSDCVIIGEFSDNPDSTNFVKAKDIYKSGFFYIEGVFYNDCRSQENMDYSRSIIDWANDGSRAIGPFASTVMENTLFLDLHLRLGQPYVYVHQGDCEHIIVFSDMRLVHAEDSQNLSDYPLLIAKHRDRRVQCRVCLTHSAKWMTEHNELTPEEPCFFCDTCFRLLHYDTSGNKITNFKAYHFVQDYK